MFKKMVRKYLLPIAGRPRFQPFWESLYRFALTAMNFGGGSDVQSSGERLVIKYLAQRISKDVTPVVFDVGANVGNYSLEVLRVLGKNVWLYCFEPSKAAFTALVRNLSEYENAKAFNIGFGEENKNGTLYSNYPGSGLGSVFARQLDHFGIEMKHEEKIKLLRLDHFCKENGISHIHLLKLDVEGNELNVLRGGELMIGSYSIDLIQFEFGGCNIDSRTFFRDLFCLLNQNYRIYRILANGLMPIDRYKEIYEIFTTTNYLGVSRRIELPLC